MATTGNLSSTSPLKGRVREILTPEGVSLRVTLADHGERVGAILIDLFCITVIIVALFFVVMGLLAISTSSADWIFIIFVIGFFFVRGFYFIFFELRWQGRTPGKRAMGIRVIDRNGGQLASEAIFARNLIREVELFIPITLFFTASHYGTQKWVLVMAGIWTGIFFLMPLFNRDRLRAGDLIGGTWVVEIPKTIMLKDLLAEPEQAEETRPVQAKYTFHPEQLGAYGVYELQTLEEILRRKGDAADNTALEVAKRIQAKIKWAESWDATKPWEFLEDFYAAQRAHLEGRMLFGERKEHKNDGAGEGS